MKKKKDGSVKIKVRYETDKLYRWNLCQKLAKTMYASTLGEKQIIENIDVILETFTIIKTK